MTEETKAPQMPPLMRKPVSLGMEVDKVDEMGAWMSLVRNPAGFNTNYPFFLAHNSMQVLEFEKLMPNPMRIRRTHRFASVESFLAYFNRYKHSGDPQLFAQRSSEGYKVSCVFDYDEPAKLHANQEDDKITTSVESEVPQWGSHIAVLELEYHPDYALLRSKSGANFSQEEFAYFIEENTHLFATPDAASMLEIALTLKGHRNVKWESGKRLQNGQVTFGYVEEIKGQTSRGEASIPEEIVLQTPIFEGGLQCFIKAALRWRISDKGEISFHYKLLSKLDERAQAEAVRQSIQDATRLHAYLVRG